MQNGQITKIEQFKNMALWIKFFCLLRYIVNLFREFMHYNDFIAIKAIILSPAAMKIG
jgi:hypothetical protein